MYIQTLNYSKICCIVLHVSQSSTGFWFFSSVNHLSEGRVNANQTVTCLPSLAENDSRLLRNSKGNPNGEWIFLSKEGSRQMQE